MSGHKNLLRAISEELEEYLVSSDLIDEIDKTDVVMLAGGYGKRMGMPDTPKPLVKLANGETLIEHSIKYFKNCGFSRFKILTGYKGGLIEKLLGDGKRYGVEIFYLKDPEMKYVGKGKALKNAIEKGFIDERSVITYSDDLYWPKQLPRELFVYHELKRSLKGIWATILAVAGYYSQFGIIKGKNGIVKEFVEKPLLPFKTSTGTCIMEKEVYKVILDKIDMNADHPVEFERVVYPCLKEEKKLAYYLYGTLENAPDVWTPINTIKDLEVANEKIKAKA